MTADTSNKQLAFVEHVVRALRPGGRAGIVVPDNVLFADGAGRELRCWMMDVADLHTILRLPTGIFYAQGLKTNVLFLRRGPAGTIKANTQAVWVYDMRAGQSAYGKTRPLRADDFAAFEAAYGDDPNGTAARTDLSFEGRFRRFSRTEITARADNLDIAWLRGSDEAGEDSPEELEDILEAMRTHLARALAEVELLVAEFSSEPLIEGSRVKVARTLSISETAISFFDGPFGSNKKSVDYTNSDTRVVRLENIGHRRFIGEKRRLSQMRRRRP